MYYFDDPPSQIGMVWCSRDLHVLSSEHGDQQVPDGSHRQSHLPAGETGGKFQVICLLHKL